MFSMAVALGVPYQFWSQLLAPVQALPGTSTRLVAPAVRMAEIALLAAVTHCSVGIEFGSFIKPKTTCELSL